MNSIIHHSPLANKPAAAGKRWVTLGFAILIAVTFAACPKGQKTESGQGKAEGQYLKGRQLMEEGKRDEAIAAWKKAVQINPEYFDAHFELGLAYKKKGDEATQSNDSKGAETNYNLAVEHYKKAISINNNDPSAHNNLANVYFVLQRYDESIEEYQQAIRLKPYDPDYHYNLANVYGKKNMAKQAIEHYEEAIRIDVNYFDAYFNIANLYEKMGDKNNAIRYYQEYVNRENRPSEAEWVQKARQKIQTLQQGLY